MSLYTYGQKWGIAGAILMRKLWASATPPATPAEDEVYIDKSAATRWLKQYVSGAFVKVGASLPDDVGLGATAGPEFAHLHLTDLAALMTPAESWIGPSAGAGVYFKNGFVGIGTVPSYKLHVVNTAAAVAVWVESHLTPTAPNYGQVNVFDDNTYAADVGGRIAFGGYTNTGVYTTFGVIRSGKDNATADNTAGYLSFWTRAHGINNIERMRILSSGGVKVVGAFSCNGTEPQTAYAVGASASTDLATVIAQCNKIRLALVANGIGASA